MTSDELARLMELPVDELRRRARIPFRLLPDQASLISDFARSLLDRIRTHNQRGEPARFILPVGPVAQYRQVVEISNRERLSWKNVHTFNMDEFLDWQGRPIPVTHPLSFEGFMRREVFGRLDRDLRPPESQQFFPHPFRIDEISAKIQAVGGIDCCYGGIGYHGHVAFNEPPLSRWARISVDQLRNSLTRVVALGDDSIVVQSIHSSGGNSAAIPPMAVTLGMKDILASRKIRLYCAAGERHRAVFRISVAGRVSVDFPSTLVQGHPDAEVVTDQATALPIQVGLR
ncbi:MAG: glucosamine-6-phosphate isomerase [Acidobacteria bacterium]|nr:glucosamine-6-phosphate isomerase [Acidobacteriota bacterium]